MTEPARDNGQPTASDHRWPVLVIVAIAQLMAVLDATIVNIALPSAQHALGFPNSGRQWVVTVYALAFGGLLLLGGRIGDMFSRKWVLITGLTGFAGASAAGGAASAAIARKLGYRLERVEAGRPEAPGESGRLMVWIRDAAGTG